MAETEETLSTAVLKTPETWPLREMEIVFFVSNELWLMGDVDEEKGQPRKDKNNGKLKMPKPNNGSNGQDTCWTSKQQKTSSVNKSTLSE